MKQSLKYVAITSLLLLTIKTSFALVFLQAYEQAEKSDSEILAASFVYQAGDNLVFSKAEKKPLVNN